MRSLLILGVANKIAKRRKLLKYVSKSWKLIVRLLLIRRSICLIDSEVLWQNAPKYSHRYVTISSLAESDVLKLYGFKTKNQLHRCTVAFNFLLILELTRERSLPAKKCFLLALGGWLILIAPMSRSGERTSD